MRICLVLHSASSEKSNGPDPCYLTLDQEHFERNSSVFKDLYNKLSQKLKM